MSLTDTITSILPKGPAKYPRETAKVPTVQKQLVEANAVLAALMQRVPDAALAATLQEPGAADAFDSLKANITSAQKRVDDLTSAMTAAEAHDNALIRRQVAARHKNTVLAIQRYLSRRDEAASKFSTAMESAIAAYRDMVDVAGKAEAQAHNLAPDVVSAGGWRLAAEELYKSAAGECTRLSVPWPLRPEHADLAPFPYDRSGASTIFDRDQQQPLADDLRRRSSELVEALTGQEPSVD